MKKLLALLLSVIMAMSLTAPAFAAESDEAPVDGDPGFFTENGIPAPTCTPGDAIPISAILDESVGIIGGADGPTAVITTGPVGLGGLDLSGLGSIFTTVSQSNEPYDPDEYLASHPGLEEELKASAYDYFDRQYSAYWSLEEYMEFAEMTEDEFLDLMVDAQILELMSKDMAQKAIDSQKEALGGVAGQVGVMVNGKYIQFPDAAPEVVDGTTMVPIRALAETLGGEAEYNDGLIVCKTDGVRLTFTLDKAEVLVEYPSGEALGDGQMFPLDCAPYIKDGRTYVPVRFISEALGYDVGWDNQYETAILLDRQALASELDKGFTILNRAQKAANPTLEEGKSWGVDMKGGFSATVFDTLSGNKTYHADLTSKTLMNIEAASGTCSVTLSDDTVNALMELAADAGTYMDDEDVELLRSVLTGLKEMEVIMTREGLVWVHAPILDELSGEKNVWGAMDMGAEMGGLMFAQMGTATTVGSTLSAMLSGGSVTEMTGFNEIVKFMVKLYGDSQFTTTGGTSTLTIGVDELMALYEDMGLDLAADEIKDVWKEYSITMNVDSKGGVTMTSVMETEAQMGVPAIRITMDSTQSGQRATMTMKVHVANLGELEMTLTASQQTTSEAPKTEPPKDATILDSNDLTPELLEP